MRHHILPPVIIAAAAFACDASAQGIEVGRANIPATPFLVLEATPLGGLSSATEWPNALEWDRLPAAAPSAPAAARTPARDTAALFGGEVAFLELPTEDGQIGLGYSADFGPIGLDLGATIVPNYQSGARSERDPGPVERMAADLNEAMGGVSFFPFGSVSITFEF